MKTRHLVILLILTAVVILLWWLLPRGTTPLSTEPSQSAAERGERRRSEANAEANESSGPENISPGHNVPSDVMEFVRRTREDPTYEWKQPINFYGKAVDENGEPVPGASVDFKWNDLSPDGTSESQATSDSNGYFSLLNRTGKRLYVQVHKEGYYTSRQTGVAFEYANPADGLFTPDPNNPVVFHLRKKGEAEPLIHGLKLFGTRVDGTMSYVDLREGKNKLVPPGDLTVQCTRSEWNSERKFDWVFTLSVPDGGIIESSEEFMFLAPEQGYEPSIEIGYRADDDNWRSREKRKFFIKSRGGKHYARIEITLLPNYRDQGAYHLEWFLNTSGSRNLEYDEAVQPKETFFE